MRIIKSIATFFVLLCSVITVSAQAPANSGIEMADRLREDGKIYVVIGVVLIILTGLIVYLIQIDRKVSKMEKEIEADKEKK